MAERDKPEQKGKINLKHSGTLPLVTNLRLLALRAGIEETNTRARIQLLHERGDLTNDDNSGADAILGIYSG